MEPSINVVTPSQLEMMDKVGFKMVYNYPLVTVESCLNLLRDKFPHISTQLKFDNYYVGMDKQKRGYQGEFQDIIKMQGGMTSVKGQGSSGYLSACSELLDITLEYIVDKYINKQ